MRTYIYFGGIGGSRTLMDVIRLILSELRSCQFRHNTMNYKMVEAVGHDPTRALDALPGLGRKCIIFIHKLYLK